MLHVFIEDVVIRDRFCFILFEGCVALATVALVQKWSFCCYFVASNISKSE